MKLGRTIRRSATLATLALGLTAGCRIISDPADLNRDGLDGLWGLTSINGTLVSSYNPGFPLPQRSDFLAGGLLQFRTTLAWGGSDQEGSAADLPESVHEGTALGVYALVNAQNVSTAARTEAGSFEYDVISEAVKLSALGRSITGTRSTHNTIIFTQQNVPFLGTVTLVFTKRTTL